MEIEPTSFTVPIQVRYADIDSLQHVNNARYFSFMEQARASYFAHLGLWNGERMRDLSVILAQTSCQYKRPIRFGDAVFVRAKTVRLGGKSFDMRYELVDDKDTLYAVGEATLVCFDYHENRAIPIPREWRRTLAEFEGLD
ncbi:MAG: acyl-CoA thioesterase [Anaerolineales bacterium]